MIANVKYLKWLGISLLVLNASPALARAQDADQAEPRAELERIEVTTELLNVDDNLDQFPGNDNGEIHRPYASDIENDELAAPTLNPDREPFAVSTDAPDYGERRGRKRQSVIKRYQYQTHPGMNHSQEIDPEIERTAASIREVVKILREAKDDKTRNTAAAELKKLFEKAFDRDYERRHKELTKLADRVAMLRVQLDRRRESRDDIIDVRVKSLLYEAEGIGFPGDLGLGPPSAAFDAYAPRTRAPWLPPYFPPVPPGSAEPSRNRP